jgi:hypothetical protein
MDITYFTTAGEVRTTVGLSTEELPDTTLESEIYANVLQLALRGVSLPTTAPGTGTLEARFLLIADKDETSRTDTEQELYNLTRIFSTYAVALEVVTSLSTRTPKLESDGKRTITRFSPEATFLTTIDSIKKVLGDIRQKLEGIGETAITVLPLLSVVTPAVNVVTNE